MSTTIKALRLSDPYTGRVLFDPDGIDPNEPYPDDHGPGCACTFKFRFRLSTAGAPPLHTPSVAWGYAH